MLSLRSINNLTSASIAAGRRVAGIPMVASLSIPAVLLLARNISGYGAPLTESPGTATRNNINPHMFKASTHLSRTLKRLTLEGMEDKVAVVTGCARDIGNCIADVLCDVNLKALVIFDVSKEHGEKAVVELSDKYGIPVVFHQVEFCNQASVQAAADATVQQVGQIHFLFASIGIDDSNLLGQPCNLETIKRLIEINLTGTFVCVQAVGNAMIKSHTDGTLVTILSMTGHIVNLPRASMKSTI